MRNWAAARVRRAAHPTVCAGENLNTIRLCENAVAYAYDK